jgi:hypothetical protein
MEDLLLNLQTCCNFGAGVLCLPETNTNWNHQKNMSTLKSNIKKVWQHSASQSSSSSEEFISNYQPGGTLTIVVNQWTSRIMGKGTDPFGLGRWSYITLRGKATTKITIVTGYRVCRASPTTAGVKTAYMQQYRGLSAKLRNDGKGTTPDPCRQFILDLQAWLEHIIQDGHQVILSMDSNEDLYTSHGKYHHLEYKTESVITSPQHDGTMATLLKTCGLIDILQVHHTNKAPPTYNRGNTRLDYILVSDSIAQTVLCSGILPFYSLFLSDHRPCYIDIDAMALFQDHTSPIAPPNMRGLQLSDPRKVKQYVDSCKKQVIYHKIMEKTHELHSDAPQDTWNNEHIEEYEKIDQLNSEIMRCAEKKLLKKISKKYDWSPALAQANNKVIYWRLKLKRSKGLFVSDSNIQSTSLSAGLPPDLESVTNRQEILDNLRNALKERRTKRISHAELRQNWLLQLVE